MNVRAVRWSRCGLNYVSEICQLARKQASGSANGRTAVRLRITTIYASNRRIVSYVGDASTSHAYGDVAAGRFTRHRHHSPLALHSPSISCVASASTVRTKSDEKGVYQRDRRVHRKG